MCAGPGSFPWIHRRPGVQFPFTNATTGPIPDDWLRWPPGWEKWKGIIGQRIVDDRERGN